MDIKSADGYEGTEEIKFFKDDRNTCYIRFRNGVVKITSENIELLQLSEVKDKGAVWESEILKHEIKLDDEEQKKIEDELKKLGYI